MKIRIKMRHVIGDRLMDDGIEISTKHIRLVFISEYRRGWCIRCQRLMKYEN